MSEIRVSNIQNRGADGGPIITGVTTIRMGAGSGEITFDGGNIDGVGVITASSLSGAQITNADTYTQFDVSNNGASDYRFASTGIGFTENKDDPTLYLIRGKRYKFSVNASGHPFYIKDSVANGGTNDQYADGVEGNGTAVGIVTFTVPFDAPSLLYYQCSNHSGMQGKMYILNDTIGPDSDVSTSGNITVTGSGKFTGDGSGLTSLPAGQGGIGVKTDSGTVGYGVTLLAFTGAGASTLSAVTAGVATIHISGGGGSGGGSGNSDGSDFNTSITNGFSTAVTGIGNTILTLPTTATSQYVVYSILASNVAAGNTEVNFIGAFDIQSNDDRYAGLERTYFAYNVPIPTGTAREMLLQPQVLNPSDSIIVRSTDFDRNGQDDLIEVSITYEEKTSSTDYFCVGVSSVAIGSSDITGIFTSSTDPSIVQSIRLVNNTDSGAYPATVQISNGIHTNRIVENLIVPKYASVELLDQPKRLPVNATIDVQFDQPEMMSIQISGKKITS